MSVAAQINPEKNRAAADPIRQQGLAIHTGDGCQRRANLDPLAAMPRRGQYSRAADRRDGWPTRPHERAVKAERGAGSVGRLELDVRQPSDSSKSVRHCCAGGLTTA